MAGAAIFAGIVLTYVSASRWFLEPSLGIFGVTFLALCNAVLVIQLISGVENRKGIYAGFGTAIAMAFLYHPMQGLMPADASFLNIFLALVGAIAVLAHIFPIYLNYYQLVDQRHLPCQKMSN